MTTEQSLREEFENHAELAGEHGYCNPIMAKKIADYWLSKFAAYKDSFLKDAKELHEKFLTGNIREDVKKCKDSSCDHYTLGIDDFYHDLLSKQDTQ